MQNCFFFYKKKSTIKSQKKEFEIKSVYKNAMKRRDWDFD